MALAVDVCVAQHIGDRGEQQDRVAILPHSSKGVALAVVADGMGGHAGGALAAEQVIHTSKLTLQNYSPTDDNAQQLLESCMSEAHMMIKASRFINEKDPHSTAVMLLIQPHVLTWAHCGDSRLYRCRGGQMLTRTIDHSYVEHLIAQGRITPEQALNHPNRNVLITSLGGDDEPIFSFNETRDIAAGDSFVLCSDGLWAYFSDEEIAVISGTQSARQASAQLIRLARKRAQGKGDNVSAAVVRFFEAPKKKTNTFMRPPPHRV